MKHTICKIAIVATVTMLSPQLYAAVFCVGDAVTLTSALNVADNNGQHDEVLIQSGLYSGNFVYNANAVETGDVTIRGGYDATCTVSSGMPADTVLDGGGVARTIVLSGRDNSDLVVEAMTIRNGLGQMQGAGADVDRWVNATFSNNVFTANNTAAGQDGSAGMEIDQTQAVVVNNNVFDSNAGGKGGGLSVSDMSSASITRNIFSNNSATFSGGGLDVSTEGLVTIANNLIYRNTSVEDGAGISLSLDSVGAASTSQATNNTIVNNVATQQGGGIDLKMTNDASTAAFHNNIFWSNSAIRGNDLNIDNDDEQNGVASAVILEFNDFNQTPFLGFFSTLPIPIGASNFNAVDPQFANAPADNYRLAPGSTLVDAGDNGAPAAGVLDLDGAPRIQGGRIDLGAYEQSVDSDADGIADVLDNCTLIANSDQRDTNGDGFGNACDPDLNNDGTVNFADIPLWVPFFNTMTNGDADFNGDGIANFSDYALFGVFFLQAPGPSGVAP